tara:strand:+ start:34 stop:618 length:585 start_codon:yes stop_codon:yes gene_type:complete
MKKKPNIQINKVYTRKGDSGKTQLIDKGNISKSNIRVDCYGEVDELNSNLGFCIALMKKQEIDFSIELNILKDIQNDLFNLGTILAISDDSKLEQFPRIDNKSIESLENKIDYYNKDLDDLKSFVLPSGSLVGAYFHICRTVCRRVERKCVFLSEKIEIDMNVLKYLNRLSDLLFVMSRWMNKKQDFSEDLWTP